MSIPEEIRKLEQKEEQLRKEALRISRMILTCIRARLQLSKGVSGARRRNRLRQQQRSKNRRQYQ